MTAAAHLRTDREIALRQSLSRLAVLSADTPLESARLWAANAIAGAGDPETLRERALAAGLGWIAALPDGTPIAEVRTSASAALTALDSPVKRLEFWTEYYERRIARSAAARALP